VKFRGISQNYKTRNSAEFRRNCSQFRTEYGIDGSIKNRRNSVSAEFRGHPNRREGHQLFFGLRLESEELHHSAIQTNIEEHFGGFFHQIKVCQPIGRKDSMQIVIRISRRLDLFLHEAAQNLNSSQIFKIKMKKSKTYSG
jgi:hypothetical protein